ncbi:response regulator transcription factor [Streptococcus gallinaceus]|uniref:DNA-binding response OmpR family regulator n=1 Tax=Streptococcus gallinaceus TaxID=165758 RepID=A0ABV2JI24_9STRE
MEAFLTDRGYHVLTAKDGEEAIEKFGQASLAILDIMMPKKDGLEVLNTIRQVSQMPVLMLTALTDEHVQFTSFDELADDFIEKPFSLLILLKQVEDLLRRCETPDRQLWQYKEASVDFDSFQAYYAGDAVSLTTKEIQLLHYLVDHPRMVLSRDQILSAIWDDFEASYERVIDIYIKNLRKNCI